jgi:hypothetical protein
MKKTRHRKSNIRIRVFERLKRSRLRKVCAIQTKPYLHHFFIKIINDQLACEDDVIVSRVLCDQLGRRSKDKSSFTERSSER